LATFVSDVFTFSSRVEVLVERDWSFGMSVLCSICPLVTFAICKTFLLGRFSPVLIVAIPVPFSAFACPSSIFD